ncbi:hypothetical protein NW762_002919 [Fusarium torreyae]|uniref:Catalase core domain-containing protein n=1 Tax=Fusarium torreyae TaxID=1237075 RepID=A0A9W8VN32_9HYPO|nr:hypothetical protein NW762_002919 [Fusarium torreyae]
MKEFHSLIQLKARPKQQHLNRSKNLECIVRPYGSGAFGYFECTQDPFFFCRDPIQEPDVDNPSNFLLDHDALLTYGPTLRKLIMPVQYSSVTMEHPRTALVPWLWLSHIQMGQLEWRKQFTDSETMAMCGEDSDYSKRDLWEAIEKGEEIEWTAHVQVMDPRQADPDKLGFDPFDVTKVWPRSQFPMKEFGHLVLNKNPENFHRDVEQAAFSPGSMVPGIEDSPDALLQFRMFFYRDAQYHRIGINLHQIPVNCPFMAKSYASLNFDGPMRVDANHAGNKQYAPNSFAHKFRPDTAESPYQVNNSNVSRASHYWHEGRKNDYDQAKELWNRVMSAQEKKNTCYNAAKGLRHVKYPDIQSKYLAQVKELAETAQEWYKEPKFRPGPDSKLVGYPPAVPVYQA